MLFEKELLQELTYEDDFTLKAGDYSFETDALIKTIYNNIVDSSRWSEQFEQVFSVTVGDVTKYYRTYYSVGATEMQDERAYEYSPDMIDCTEVEPKEVKVIQYFPVK